MQRVLQEHPVLLPQRLVQAQRRNGALDVLLVGLRVDQDVDGIADGKDAEENQQRHDEEHHYALHQAPDDENQHIRTTILSRGNAHAARERHALPGGAAAMRGTANSAAGSLLTGA
ncbi:hypothetical protein D3C81_1588210 [compost metagenome]